jgi:hypothetical protein
MDVRSRIWRRLRRNLVPLWLGEPLFFLGAIFIVFKPLGALWFMYGAALAVAAFRGVWTAQHYEVTVLEWTPDALVVRKRRRRRYTRTRQFPRPSPRGHVDPSVTGKAFRCLQRAVFWFVAWLVPLMILGATLPEAIGGTLSAVYLLLTFVALAFYARRRHKRRARAGRVATLSQTQDIRHWT